MLVTVGSAWHQVRHRRGDADRGRDRVIASSTGMPAAISAPKASSMSSSVIGRLMPSAEDRSSPTRSLMAVSIETSPASRTRARDGRAAIAAVTRLHVRRVVDGALQVNVDQQSHCASAFHCGAGHSVTPLTPARSVFSCAGDRARLRGGRRTAVTGGDQDVLDLVVGEAAGRGHRVGAAGLSEPVVGVLGLLGRDQRGQRDGDRDEREPGADRAPRMGRAPASGTEGHPGHELGRWRCRDMAGSSRGRASGLLQPREIDRVLQEWQDPDPG